MGADRAPSARPRALYAALLILYLLHNDLWLWSDARLVLGLPVGLVYHIGFCLVTAAVLALLVRWAWPELTTDEGPGSEHPTSDGTGGGRSESAGIADRPSPPGSSDR